MRWTFLAVSTAVILAVATPAAAQIAAGEPVAPEVAVSVGIGGLWNGGSSLGSGSTLGAAAILPVWRRLAIRVDAHRSFGPEPEERTCASFPSLPCSGSSHS